MSSEADLSEDIRLARHIRLLHQRGIKEVRFLATDFDGTITAKNVFPAVGEFRRGAMDTLKAFQQAGGKVLVFTCREGVWLDRALSIMRLDGFKPDFVNEQTWDELKGARKPYWDLYIDDRALGCVLDWPFIGKLLKEMAPRDRNWFGKWKDGSGGA